MLEQKRSTKKWPEEFNIKYKTFAKKVEESLILPDDDKIA